MDRFFYLCAMTRIHHLKIYNSLTGQKEVFEPIHENHVGMYVCGPTVYSNVHLGNVRTFMSFDVIFRYLKFLGYKVRYVRNITDVGHIVDDVDDGEDKIAKRARLEQLEPMEIVQKYTVDFHTILSKFNFLPPSIEPTATGHIIEQIQIVQEILDNGLAYISNGSVYFDVLKYNESKPYGILSGRNLEDMISNSRDLDGQDDKKNAVDFALWKKAEPEHIMRWPSPWGDGFPGWHLECTAMSTKYLGTQFDIHGGGMDLKFPHHECEIAQNEAAKNHAPVKYWMHANLLTLNGKKMAKSTGNSILPGEILSGDNNILSKAFSAAVVRFFMLQAHYRSILDFSDEAILAAEKGFNRLVEAVATLDKIEAANLSTFDVKSWIEQGLQAMDDDFNTPILIANLFEAVKVINSLAEQKTALTAVDLREFKTYIHAFIEDILGIELESKSAAKDELIPQLIDLLIAQRNQARADKNWKLSDELRDNLLQLGIELKDGKDGTTYKY